MYMYTKETVKADCKSRIEGERFWDKPDSGLVTIQSLRKGLRSAMRAEAKIILLPVGIASYLRETGQLVDNACEVIQEELKLSEKILSDLLYKLVNRNIFIKYLSLLCPSICSYS